MQYISSSGVIVKLIKKLDNYNDGNVDQFKVRVMNGVNKGNVFLYDVVTFNKLFKEY